MSILVTGAAGFIGMHVCKRLLDRGEIVIGIDNLNNYYDVKLKKNRLNILKKNKKFLFFKVDIQDNKAVKKIFYKNKINKVVHLAAQAGVRYSIQNPHAYIDSNINGFVNILEQCRHCKVEHLVYASSSSVYGGNTKLPFRENHNVDHPVSLYAATKKSNELMAHTYSHLFRLPTTGLRFFTVYGPGVRPDMALFLFTDSILKNKKINVFNRGDMLRDFTFIDDIVTGVLKVLDKTPRVNKKFDTKKPDPSGSFAPYKIFNIGNSHPETLMNYIRTLEKHLGIKAKIRKMPMQPGDVKATNASMKELDKWVRYKPKTTINQGIKKFVNWYLKYHGIK